MRGSGSAPAATARRSAQAAGAEDRVAGLGHAPASARSAASRGRGSSAETSQPVAIVAAGLEQVARRRRARPRGSRRSRSRASAARRPRSRAARARAMPSASSRRRPGTPFALPAPLELVEAGELGLGRGDDQLAAALERDARAARSTRTARAAPRTHSSRLQRARRVVDAGVDRRPSCARSGGCRSRPPARARRRCCRAGARSARGRPRGRGSPRRRPRCHVSRPRIRSDTLLRCRRSRS